MKPRTPKREQFLLDLFITAIENYGYGFFVTEQYVWDVPAAQAYAVIADKQDESQRWRVDIDTMAEGLRVIRTAKQVTQGGETYRVNTDGQRLYPRVSDAFVAATCPPRHPAGPVEQVHADLAAAIQERTEQVMLHLVRRARELTRARRLCLGGGVAANCVAVGKIVEAGLFEQVHVPPAPGDSGTAIGAALDASNHTPDGLSGCYLGPAYPGLELPERPRPGMTACRPAEPAKHLAGRLAAGGIVGLFHGGVEAGPRALGNRSILASPLQPDVVDRLNRTVKFREPFRPFAPVVLADAAQVYFTLAQPSPYMSIAAPVTDFSRRHLPPIVHTNGTARVQTVTQDDNPFLAEVLAEFAAITGHPVLINTSLNIKGKPICGTPDMALDCLTGSGLDALLLGGWWIEKC